MRAVYPADGALRAAAAGEDPMTDSDGVPWAVLISALIWATVRLLTSDRLTKRPDGACPECGHEQDASDISHG